MSPHALPGASTVASALRDPDRTAALRRTGLLVGAPDPVFDRLTELAAAVLRVPVALVSVVDVDRQVFVGCLGLPEPWATRRETPLSHSFCQHVVGAGTPLVISDAREHPLVRDNLAIRDLGVVAYAGVPLVAGAGGGAGAAAVLGSFCVIDTRPREWTDDELAILRRLAESAVTEIELRTAERAASESAARLEAAMDSADLGAWSYDVAERTRWNSPRASQMLGLAAVETVMTRDEWLAHLHPDDRARVGALLDASVDGGDRYAAEYRVADARGATRRIAGTGRVLRGADGRVERVIGTVRDVTELARLEAERQESVERLRTLVEAAPLFAWLNRADGTVELFNRRWYAHTGQDESYAADGRWVEAIHPEDRGRTRAARERGLADGQPYEVEFRVRGADGAYRWAVARVEPVRGADGVPTAWVGAAIDIHDRRALEAALRESELRFRTLQDVSPDGSALLTAVRDEGGAVVDFVVAYANGAAARILTGDDAPLIGRSVRDAFPESVAAGRLDVYRHIVETGEPWQRDIEYTRGRVRRGLRLNAVKIDDGVHLDFADLTERIEAARERERLLAEAETARGTLSEILESITAAFLAVDAGWRITYVNAAAERYFGRARAALLGRSIWEAFPLTVASEHAERLSRAMRTRETEQYELLSPTFGRWLRVRADPAGGGGGGLSIFVEDVDERRRAEAWRDGQRRVLEQIAASRPLGDVLAAVAALVESQLHGGLASVLLLDEEGGRLRHAAAPSLSDAFVRAIDGVRPGPDAGTCGRAAYTGAEAVTEDVAADPGWAPFRAAAAAEGLRSCWSRPIVAADRRVLGTFAVYGRSPRVPTAHDRTLLDEATHLAGIAVERARSEAERDRLLAAERRARADAEAARATADAANRSKSDFLAMMSHELRTPLNAIGGYAELIEMGVRGPVTPEQRLDLARLQKSQRHLLGLINGVLDYAKVDAGAVQYDVSAVPLDEVLATCDALVMPQARAKGLTLQHAERDPDLRVLADREKVQQVVLNLLSNAVKFTEPGGRVVVACAAAAPDGGAPGGTVRISVADTGRGIPPDQLARVFEPFVQVDARLTRTREGTGLGLAISRDLARGMGGDLTAESTPGAGSVFTVTLPAAPRD